VCGLERARGQEPQPWRAPRDFHKSNRILDKRALKCNLGRGICATNCMSPESYSAEGTHGITQRPLR
jgi:hypothetical protein